MLLFPSTIMPNVCRVLQDHTTSSGVHGQALDSLKETLRKTEDTLRLVQVSEMMTKLLTHN